jgi:hypothetical protein
MEWQVHCANLRVRMLHHGSPKSAVASESGSDEIDDIKPEVDSQYDMNIQ